MCAYNYNCSFHFDVCLMIKFLWAVIKRFLEARCFLYSAGLSYYMIFALPAVLLWVVFVVWLFLQDQSVLQHLHQQASFYLWNEQALAWFDNMLRYVNAWFDTSYWFFGLLFVLYIIAWVMSLLKRVLCEIWDIPYQWSNWKWMLWEKWRWMLFLFVLCIMFVVSLVFHSFFALFGDWIINFFADFSAFVWVGSFLVFLFVTYVLLLVVISYFLWSSIWWKQIHVATIVTLILFVPSKYLIDYYVWFSSSVSLYGAATSLVAILLWIYYAICVFFFGLCFSKVLCDKNF